MLHIPATLAAPTLAAMLTVPMVTGCQGLDEQQPRRVGIRPQAGGRPMTDQDRRSSLLAEVEVQLDDRTIEMPSTLPAGNVTLQISNAGEAEHGFVIEGRGLRRRVPGLIAAGGTEELVIDLEPGVYQAYCPVPGHREQGMESRLRVIP